VESFAADPLYVKVARAALRNGTENAIVLQTCLTFWSYPFSSEGGTHEKDPFVSASLLVAGMTSIVGAADTKSTTGEKPNPSPGWVVIEEDIWVRFVDEPSHHMLQAHENFLKKDFKAAAHDPHLVGGHLYGAAGTAVGDTKIALLASARELDRLAKDVESGVIKSAKMLEAPFARAEHALASHHLAKAQHAITSKRHATAGHYLHSAVNDVEYAAKWSGHELLKGAVATIAARSVVIWRAEFLCFYNQTSSEEN
jgi:hypothetical protein